jgi:hypothetical protein
VNGFDLLTTASVAGKRIFRCGAIQLPSLVVNLLRRRQQQNALATAKRGKEEHLPVLIDNPPGTDGGWRKWEPIPDKRSCRVLE